MQTILVVVHLFLALSIVALVLIQHGKGADAGAAFGSGASATVFGARGSTSFLSHTTATLAAFFFVTSLALAYYASQSVKPKGIMDQTPTSTDNKKAATPTQESVHVAKGDVPLIPPAAIDIKKDIKPLTIPVTASSVKASIPIKVDTVDNAVKPKVPDLPPTIHKDQTQAVPVHHLLVPPALAPVVDVTQQTKTSSMVPHAGVKPAEKEHLPAPVDAPVHRSDAPILPHPVVAPVNKAIKVNNAAVPADAPVHKSEAPAIPPVMVEPPKAIPVEIVKPAAKPVEPPKAIPVEIVKPAAKPVEPTKAIPVEIVKPAAKPVEPTKAIPVEVIKPAAKPVEPPKAIPVEVIKPVEQPVEPPVEVRKPEKKQVEIISK